MEQGPAAREPETAPETDPIGSLDSLDVRTRRLLAALLAVDAGSARMLRAAAARARPRPQTGPSADHGD